MSYLFNSVYFLLFIGISFSQSFGWENNGTVLGSWGDNIQSENVSSSDGILPYDGNSMLKLTESPLDGTPQAYLAHIINLNAGDVVSASFYTYDSNPESSPSARIWGSYATNLDIGNYQGSAGGNSNFPSGNGWEEVSHTWEIAEGNEGLVIQARLYSGNEDPTSFLFDSITVTAPESATVIFPGDFGDLVLGCTNSEACNFNSNATYEDGSCTYPSEEFCDCFGNSVKDCNDVCGGSAVEDIFSVCDGDNTIQNAINNAQENDVITVPAGTYFESLVVNNSVSIVCGDPALQEICILDARGLNGSAVTFNTNEATLDGFTIPGDNTMFAGVVISPSSSNIQVLNNTIYGMTLPNPSNDSPLSYGVLAYGNSEQDRPTNIAIIGNDISMIGGSAISLGDFTGPVSIKGNNISNIIPVEVLGQPFSTALQGRYAGLAFENNTVSNVLIGLNIPFSFGGSFDNSYTNVPTYLSTTIESEYEFQFNESNDLNYWISETTLEDLGLALEFYVSSLDLAISIADSGSEILGSDGSSTSQDCNGDWAGSAKYDACGICDGSNIIAPTLSGWQPAFNDDNHHLTCISSAYTTDDYNYIPFGVTLEQCISNCQNDIDCNAIESDAINDGEGFCWMWLNGSCDLLVDDIDSVPGLLVWDEDLDSSNFGPSGYHYQFTGVCNCEGSVVDDCGVCEGDNTSCLGCDGVTNSGLENDGCGICNGNNFFNQEGLIIFNSACGCPDENGAYPDLDCDGNCDFDSSNDLVVDGCGVCGGDDSSCTDCNGVLNGLAVFDECGICGGDNYLIDPSSCTTNSNLTPNIFILDLFDQPGTQSLHFINEDNYYLNNSENSDFIDDNNQPLPEKLDFSDVSFNSESRVFLGSINFGEYGTSIYGDTKWDYEIIFNDNFDSIIGGSITYIDGEGDVRSVIDLQDYGRYNRYCEIDYFEGTDLDCAGECNGSAVDTWCDGSCGTSGPSEDECGTCNGNGTLTLDFENWSSQLGDCDNYVTNGWCLAGDYGPNWLESYGLFSRWATPGQPDAGIACFDCGGGIQTCDCEGTLDLGCGCGVPAPEENFDCDGNCIVQTDEGCECGQLLDECGVCGGHGINANGWQVSTTNIGTSHGCDINFYSTPLEYVQVESESFENCAYQCENYSESCTSFEFKRESSYTTNCLLWLNDACDLNAEELPLGYMSDSLTVLGEDWDTYTYTGVCDCDGSTIDCAGTCGLAELDVCGNCLGDCAENENNVITCSDNQYNVVIPDCLGVCGGSSEFDGENCLTLGCVDDNACNHNPDANVDDGSCLLPVDNYDCFGECIAEVNCLGQCGIALLSDELCLAHDNKNLIAAGGFHSAAIQYDGTVVGWGRNNDGESTPPEDLSDVVQLALSGIDHYSLALKSDGTVVGWGRDNYGQASPPDELTDVVSVSAGYYHSLALQSDGTVVGWGRNNNAQLDIPIDLTDVVAIDAGQYYHSIALTKNGTVVGWGRNNEGQLNIPEDLTDVVAIASARYSGFALQSDGTVVGWGSDGNNILDIPGDLSDVVAIDAGSYHVLALKSDGTVVTWGSNGNNLQTIPEGLDNVVAISASGDGHSLALQSDGTVVGWGRTNEGQVNVPDYLQFSIPCNVAGDLYDCTGECGGSILTDGCGYCGGAGDQYICSCDEDLNCSLECSGETNCLGLCGEVSDELCLAHENKNLIKTGAYFSLSLQQDGTVVGWGRNNNGEVTFPEDLANVSSITGGRHHGLALQSDGTVVGWGWDNYGQASPPDDLSDAVSISAGYYHSLALKSDGTVVGWGRNNNAQLDIPIDLTDVVAIDASENSHNLALKKDGTVVAWGYNGYGESTVPFDLSDVMDIAAGYRSSFALKSDGTVVGWGSDGNNILDIPGDLSDVVAIDAGYYHVLALKSDGTVTTWGWDGYDLQTIPEGLDNVVAISASGDGHSLALQSDGTVVGWGRTNEGQVNVPDYLQFSIPCNVAGDLYDCTGECGGSILTDGCGYCGGAGDQYICSCDEDLNCSLECSGETNCLGLCGEVSDELCLAHENKNLIASGAYHSFALQSDSTVVGWGRNSNGETTVPEELLDVVEIAGGRHHTLALKSDGTVVGWGWDSYSQASPPEDLSDAVSISAGYYHSLALQSDGTVVGWGHNDQGQIDIPIDLKDVVAIDAGHHKHNLALKKDGTVVAWGYNGYGESTVPFDLTDVAAVSASYHTSFALKSDGTVVGWGLNNNGILNIPEDLTDVVAIDAGYYHVLALKSDGSLVTWGWDGYELQTIPEGFGNAVAVSASGDGHSFVMESINKILGWGRNSEGQINAPGSLELAIPCDLDGTIYDCLGTCGIVEQDECGVCDGPGAIYECGCSDIPEGYCDCNQDNSVNDVCGNTVPLSEGLFTIEYFSWSNDYYVNCSESSCFQNSYSSGESNEVNFNGDGSFPNNTSTGSYMSRTTGLIYAEEDGLYTFRADADDGFRLYIDENLVINNWFSGAIGSQSNDYFLSSGYHNVRLEHYDQAGHSDLSLYWTTPSESESLVQASSGGGFCDCDCNTLDGFGVCGGDAVVDCLGIINGTALFDACGNCQGDCTEDENGFVSCSDSGYNLITSDCAGLCGGDTVIDCAGECGGASVYDTIGVECCEPSALDCLGYCGGQAALDSCGNCLGDCAEDENGFVSCSDSGYNLITSDCAGLCGGESVLMNVYEDADNDGFGFGEPDVECALPDVAYAVGGCDGSNTPAYGALFESEGIFARCCSDDGFCQEYSEANINCSGEVTYDEAIYHCESQGYRLCSVEELENSLCCGTGCQYDSAYVWTSDVISEFNLDGFSNNNADLEPNVSCLSNYFDCDNQCDGTAELDDCGVCSGGLTENIANADIDQCGVCYGDNSSCEDCEGTPNGLAELDACGICHGENICAGSNCDVGESEFVSFSSLPLAVAGSNEGLENDLHYSTYNGGGDYIYSFFLEEPANMQFSTCGSRENHGLDTYISLYTGEECGNLNIISVDDDTSTTINSQFCDNPSSLDSWIQADIDPGNYYLVVGGYNGNEGSYDLYIEGNLLDSNTFLSAENSNDYNREEHIRTLSMKSGKAVDIGTNKRAVPEMRQDCPFVLGPDADCSGVCFGSAEIDGCGICDGGNYFNQNGEIISNGACGCPNGLGGYPSIDCDGVCGGENQSCNSCWSNDEESLVCMDGTEFLIESDNGWPSCDDHGSRLLCPSHWPYMCAEPDTFGGGAQPDYWCKQQPEECDALGGLRECEDIYYDCNGYAFGDAVQDECGICGGSGPEENFDCNGNCLLETDEGCDCGISKDECGVCGGLGATSDCGCSDIPEGACDCLGNTLDCEGVCGGLAITDCEGLCGGTAVEDECGICGGSGPEENFDCDGECLVITDCEGLCGGTAVEDECGVCDGDNSACLDECGIIDGDNICQDNVVCSDVTCPIGADYLCAPTPSDCYEATGCDGVTGLPDCSGDGDCCPVSWIDDGFDDCSEQQYGCDLSCYDNDGGACGEESISRLSSKNKIDIEISTLSNGFKEPFRTYVANDTRSECEFVYGPDADCNGVCDGQAIIDECGVCNGPGSIYECGCSDIPEGYCDCFGLSTILDVCGEEPSSIDGGLFSIEYHTWNSSYNGAQNCISGDCFSNLIATSESSLINFNNDSSFPNVPSSDSFMTRASGIIYVAESGVYNFRTLTDDGIRLYIDENQIINDWNTGGNQSNSVDYELNIGFYQLRMDHFDQGGPAEAHLWWTPPNGLETYLTVSDTGFCDCECNELDCAGQCGGEAIVDECGQCDGTGTGEGFCDCDGNIDLGCGCGLPAAQENFDCNGNCILETGDGCECGILLDECGVCDGLGIPTDECDCNGNTLDECGICGGSGPEENYNCEGECIVETGDGCECGILLDECGICGGSGPEIFYNCDGECIAPTSVGCECGFRLDECGICGGSGPEENYNCEGECLLDIDCFGVCGGLASNDPMGGCCYDSQKDSCGVCEGENFCAETHICGAIPAPDTEWVTCPEGADFLCATSDNDCFIATGCDGTTGVPDCSGDGDCCPAEWVGDGYADCFEQQFGCDLTCYSDDGGDCENDPGVVNNRHKLISKPIFSYQSETRQECDFVFGPDADCNGRCFGTATPDCFGECEGPAVAGENNSCCYPSSLDECGVCFGNGPEENYNCEGECIVETGDGCDCSVLQDECGLCGGDGSSCSYSAYFWLSENGKQIMYSSEEDIYGFQISIDGPMELLNVSGGDSEAAGFTVTPSQSTLLGFSFTSNFIQAGSGVLINLQYEQGSGDMCINELIVSGFGGVALSSEIGTPESNSNDTSDDCIFVDNTCIPGDITENGIVDIVDIVSIVYAIVNFASASDCADFNGDGIINILDIINMVDSILNPREIGATSATIQINGDTLNISADGFIAAVQMTLSHDLGFDLSLTNQALAGEYAVNGRETTLLVVVPSTDEIFTAYGNYEIKEILVANQTEFINVVQPSSFSLDEPFPNPFNPTTSLNMSLPEAGFVTVKAYNLSGQVVDVIKSGNMNAGNHILSWEPSFLPSGAYIIKAEYLDQVSTQKVMLMK